jgi:hypothetical protein
VPGLVTDCVGIQLIGEKPVTEKPVRDRTFTCNHVQTRKRPALSPDFSDGLFAYGVGGTYAAADFAGGGECCFCGNGEADSDTAFGAEWV